jgi:hypothetical protein
MEAGVGSVLLPKVQFQLRSSEEPKWIDPEKRDPLFQLDQVNIEEIEPLLAVPPLKK